MWKITIGLNQVLHKKFKTYIVDIDDTIFCNVEPGNYHASLPYLDRIAKINDLYDSGNTIIYWTARGANTGIDWKVFTTLQLNKAGCKYHELRFGKPHYDVWIDDKAINSEDYFENT